MDKIIAECIRLSLAEEDQNLGDYIWTVTDADRAIFKAGIKEVVDWVGSVPPVSKLPEGTMKHYAISTEQWQAKLKEWGIK